MEKAEAIRNGFYGGLRKKTEAYHACFQHFAEFYPHVEGISRRRRVKEIIRLTMDYMAPRLYTDE